MDGRHYTLGNPGNPLVQALSLVVFALILVGAVIMGAVVLAVFIGLAIIAFLAFKVRVWWFRRRARGGGPGSAGPKRTAQGIRYIEAEYEVIEPRSDESHQRSDDR